jgi:hypothetical protein
MHTTAWQRPTRNEVKRASSELLKAHKRSSIWLIGMVNAWWTISLFSKHVTGVKGGGGSRFRRPCSVRCARQLENCKLVSDYVHQKSAEHETSISRMSQRVLVKRIRFIHVATDDPRSSAAYNSDAYVPQIHKSLDPLFQLHNYCIIEMWTLTCCIFCFVSHRNFEALYVCRMCQTLEIIFGKTAHTCERGQRIGLLLNGTWKGAKCAVPIITSIHLAQDHCMSYTAVWDAMYAATLIVIDRRTWLPVAAAAATSSSAATGVVSVMGYRTHTRGTVCWRQFHQIQVYCSRTTLKVM